MTTAATLTMFGVRVRVRTQALLPYLLGVQGITIGSRIYLTGHALGIRAELLAHEFRHVLQWRDRGVIGFLWAYLSGLVLYGYGLKHPLERDAYDYAVGNAYTFRPFVDQLQRELGQ